MQVRRDRTLQAVRLVVFSSSSRIAFRRDSTETRDTPMFERDSRAVALADSEDMILDCRAQSALAD